MKSEKERTVDHIPRNRQTSETNKIGDITRFRKMFGLFQRDVSPATDDEFKNAVKVGLNDVDTLKIDNIKDHFNVMNNWIKHERNKESSRINGLSAQESRELKQFRDEVNTFYQEYKGAKLCFSSGVADAVQGLRKTFKNYAIYLDETIIPRLEVKSLPEK